MSSERAVSAHGVTPTHHRGPLDGTDTRKGWVLAAMSLGFTMTMIDATIITVALPTIQRDLDLSNTDRVWVVNAYLLVLAVSIAVAGRRPIFTQDVLGFSSFEAGLASMPSTIMLFITSPWAGKLYDRVGARVLISAGILSAAVAFAWLAALAFPKQSCTWMVPALVLAGVGIGLIQSPALTDAMNAASARMRGQAAGIIGTTQQIGGTFGVGVLTAVLTPLFLTNLVANLSDVGVQTTEQQVNARVLAEAGSGTPFTPYQIEAAKAAFSSALATSYWLIVGLLLVALLVTLLLVRCQ